MISAVGQRCGARALGLAWAAPTNAASGLRPRKQRQPGRLPRRSSWCRVVTLASHLLVSMFGAVTASVLGIALPLLRNLQNNPENSMEGIGLKRTPMGIVLDALEQQEGTVSKVKE
ncbi:unnamed protein product [Nyctereutes procyonoides]|uniref:(raccoon dog) hypothetical protein n=1 Tax=Nyctereutes procyonoides TaxID=34880 RepID=A0A811ZQI3_NYCPR|nr:unnamed protein product [Nyctereutes procyonoides]